jgi:hypothetical protein
MFKCPKCIKSEKIHENYIILLENFLESSVDKALPNWPVINEELASEI